MKSTTKTIKTPIGGNEVVINEWITGRDRQYIEAPMMSAVNPKFKPGSKDVDMGSMDLEKFTRETTQRQLEKFIVSVDGVTENAWNLVLDLHETDTKFVLEQIDELGKKKEVNLSE